MLLDHWYAFSLLLYLPVWRRSSLKKVTPSDLFLPRPGSATGRIWPKNNNTCKGPWVLHPYQVSSKSIKRFWRRSWKCEKITPDRRRRGRTDDGRCAMTIAHSSLRLGWAKNWLLYPLTIISRTSNWNFKEDHLIQGLFKDNSFSRSFPGKPKIQGVFKDCGNPACTVKHLPRLNFCVH